MRKRVTILTILLLQLIALPARSSSRIKDIGHFAGVRSNSVTGYGLVIGLNKTGDKNTTLFTIQSLASMLQRYGIMVNAATLKVQNVAAVMVTAELDAFERSGSKIDITVSSIGDASSLQGGILLPTPLLGLDNNTYVVSQGALVLGGFSTGASASSVTVNHPTVARVPNGGTVEREVPSGLPQSVETMDLVLDRADFTNAKRVSDAVNISFGHPIATSLDGRSIHMNVPPDFRQRPVDFMATVEAVTIETDAKAKVVVNERTGTVIIGSDVVISPVSIAHGNLSIQIQTDFHVSQPAPLSAAAQTIVTPETKVDAQEAKSNFVTLTKGATVDDLIRSLNALGVTPRDTIAILEALKTAGALQAELVIM